MGAAKELDTFICLTFGSSIGGSGKGNGKLLHGLGHTEREHCFIPRDTDMINIEGYVRIMAINVSKD